MFHFVCFFPSPCRPVSCSSSFNTAVKSGEALKELLEIFSSVTSHGLVLGEPELNHGFAVKNHTSVCNMEIIYAGNLQVK